MHVFWISKVDGPETWDNNVCGASNIPLLPLDLESQLELSHIPAIRRWVKNTSLITWNNILYHSIH